MQVFTLRGLTLDRCRDCGRVWLDLNEVDALLGTVEVTLSDTEVDQPCPRGHGPMMSGAVKEQPAVICATCRGAWVVDTLSPSETEAPKPPVPKSATAAKPKPHVSEVHVSCELCGKQVPLSRAVNTHRGTLCRECELKPPPHGEQAPYERYLSTSDDTGAKIGRILQLFVDTED
jgi:Zn-finger nucleic acid-binding protein